MQALGAVLPALRTRVVRPPSGARTLSHDPGRYFAPGSDLGAQLLSALDPRVADGMYAAWRRAAPAVPALLRDLQAMRVTATPFGATAPLKAVQDERGRVVRQTDWPLTGGALTAMRVVFDTAGRVPVSAEFQHVETGASVQVSENLPAEKTFPLGPGRISLMTRSAQDHDLSWLKPAPGGLAGARCDGPADVGAARTDAVRLPAGRRRPGPCGRPQRRAAGTVPGSRRAPADQARRLRGDLALHGRQ